MSDGLKEKIGTFNCSGCLTDFPLSEVSACKNCKYLYCPSCYEEVKCDSCGEEGGTYCMECCIDHGGYCENCKVWVCTNHIKDHKGHVISPKLGDI